MAKKLSSISGGVKQGGTYKPKLYAENYLKPLVNHVKSVQTNVKKVSKTIKSTVMVQGKWYDDCAANFAEWWNNTNKSMSDGIDLLNRISSVVEELVRITASDVCKAMMASETMCKTAAKQNYIVKFSKGSAYVLGIENITKKTLGEITETTCKDNADMVANDASLKSMISVLSKAFEEIEKDVKKIQQLIEKHIIGGATIDFKGQLNSATLKAKVSQVNSAMETIQDNLYNQLDKDSRVINTTTTKLKGALENNTNSQTTAGNSYANNAGAGASSSSSGQNTNTSGFKGGPGGYGNPYIKSNGSAGQNAYTSGGQATDGTGSQYAANPNAGNVKFHPNSIGGKKKVDSSSPASSYNR